MSKHVHKHVKFVRSILVNIAFHKAPDLIASLVNLMPVCADMRVTGVNHASVVDAIRLSFSVSA